MKEGIVFWYDGISSEDMGLMNVSVNGGMFEETFLPVKTNSEVQSRYNDRPYFQDTSLKPLEFELTFAFKDKFDENKLRDIARWLSKDIYKPFYTEDNLDRIFYCTLVSNSSLFHNGLNEGYITLTFRCDSPYSYSPYYISSEYTIVTTGLIVFENAGDADLKPEILIQKIGVGNVTVKNASYSGKYFTVSNLGNNEEIYLDIENKSIKSSFPATYRNNDFSGEYFPMKRGLNRLEITGDCIIKFRYKFKTLQG